MRKKRSLDFLFPKTRQLVLATLLLDPQRSWYLSDLARHLHVTPSSLQRELAGLVAAGVLRRRVDGYRTYVQADPDCPLLGELRGIMLKTVGLRNVLQDLLARYAQRIRVAFVYGSMACGQERAASDVDLMVIGQVGLSDLALPLKKAVQTLGRPVNSTVFTPTEFAQKGRAGNHFVTTVLAADKLFLVGDQRELAAITGKQSREKASHKQGRT